MVVIWKEKMLQPKVGGQVKILLDVAVSSQEVKLPTGGSQDGS